MKKLSEVFSEQHREKGRFKPTVPRMVKNKAVASPRSNSDSASVSLRERCWPGYKPAPGKKAYAKGSCVKEAITIPSDAPSIQSIAKKHGVSEEQIQRQLEMGIKVEKEHTSDIQAATEIALDHLNEKPDYYTRLKKYVEDYNGGKSEQVAGSAQSTLTDKPNKEPMKTYKDLKNITELSTELLHRYKEKAAADSAKADKEGDVARGNKRFSGVVKATNKQFANFKKKGFNEDITKKPDAFKALKPKESEHETYYKFVTGKAKIGKPLSNKEKDFVKSYKLMKQEQVEQIDEISAQAHKEYQAAARKDVASLAKHTGGEYGDIAKNIMKRRMKGLSTSTALQHRDTMMKVKKEEVEQIDEKNVPTSPEKWAQAKAQAKAKFDVYPSAYANGWAAKKYKAMGGGWKSVSEEKEQIDEEGYKARSDAKIAMAAKASASRAGSTPPFEGGTKKTTKVIPGKYGKEYSTARHLARMAMQKQIEKMKKAPIKESRKAAIVKDIMKKKKGSEDAFQKDPELSSTLTKMQ